MKRSGPIKRKSALRKVSKKQAKELKIYSAKRKEFLSSNPRCQAGNFTHCYCLRPATDIHHRAKRGKYLNDETTWMALCRSCHDWIHSHPKDARALGLLV